MDRPKVSRLSQRKRANDEQPKVSRSSQRKRASWLKREKAIESKQSMDDSQVYRTRASKPSCEGMLDAGRAIPHWASL
ncbi:hypothetical protein A2U01_0046328 [Trifolium medium]|uniref:Uncharacterized protein n=1 Tax=Trifolium medium TaxID=97028 RepID=A0A392QMH2_9FABA|nr:hypothetical protein [Trifolium medium]